MSGQITPPPALSPDSLGLILQFEVSSAQVYAQHQHPAWPGGASGVTIGIGHDLGYATTAEVTLDWRAELVPEHLQRLRTCCGIHGSAAGGLVAHLHDIVVPFSSAERVFERISIPRTERLLRAALPGCEALPADCFGALLSIAYNRGTDFSSSNPRRSEMVGIREAVRDGRFEAVPPLIRSMKRLWEGVPGLEGLLLRRDAEADLFETGLNNG